MDDLLLFSEKRYSEMKIHSPLPDADIILFYVKDQNVPWNTLFLQDKKFMSSMFLNLFF